LLDERADVGAKRVTMDSVDRSSKALMGITHGQMRHMTVHQFSRPSIRHESQTHIKQDYFSFVRFDAVARFPVTKSWPIKWS